MSDRALSSLSLKIIFMFLMLTLGYGLCFVVVACFFCGCFCFVFGGEVIFISALGLCYAFSFNFGSMIFTHLHANNFFKSTLYKRHRPKHDAIQGVL